MNETTTKEHTTMKQVHVSHASCDHDKTPAARAKCRRIRRGGAPESSKAQLVARMKDEIIDAGVRAPKKGKAKKVKEANAPVLRELLELDDEAVIESPAPVYSQVDSSKLHGEGAKLTLIPTIQAKGSKVVHAAIDNGEGHVVYAFVCTKQLAKGDAQRGVVESAHLITCKNCTKVIAK